jgi:DNA gyrase subunit A
MIDKQGNFGSIAGLPPAAMRYTEARLSPIAAMMLDDLKLDTVDYVPDLRRSACGTDGAAVSLSQSLVNGATGIAVGMATSPYRRTICAKSAAIIQLIDDPDTSIDELMDIVPVPTFRPAALFADAAAFAKVTGRVAARSRFEREPRSKRSRTSGRGSWSARFPFSNSVIE